MILKINMKFKIKYVLLKNVKSISCQITYYLDVFISKEMGLVGFGFGVLWFATGKPKNPKPKTHQTPLDINRNYI